MTLTKADGRDALSPASEKAAAAAKPPFFTAANNIRLLLICLDLPDFFNINSNKF